MRLIDADKVMQMIPTEEYNARQAIAFAPTVDAEPTEEQVIEYCRKRCLVVVDSGLFNEMKARWMQSVNDWEEPEINPCRGCTDYDGRGGCKSNGGCGAKMDQEEQDNETY